MAKQVTLNIKSLEKAIADLEAIKAKIVAETGTAAERLKRARAEALPTVKVPALAIKASQTVPEAETMIDEWKATLAQRIDEATTAILRKDKAAGAETVTALRETFKAKAEAATAIKTMLVSIKVPGADALAIPTLKGSGGGGGGGSAKVSNVQWYIVRANGNRKDMVPSQNKPSSVAWYHGAELGVKATGNKGKGCSKDEMFAALKKMGAEIPASGAEAWSFKAETGVTVGMDIVPTETA